MQAAELGVGASTHAAALDARYLSALKEEREQAAKLLGGPSAQCGSAQEGWRQDLEDALLASKLCSYAQARDMRGMRDMRDMRYMRYMRDLRDMRYMRDLRDCVTCVTCVTPEKRCLRRRWDTSRHSWHRRCWPCWCAVTPLSQPAGSGSRAGSRLQSDCEQHPTAVGLGCGRDHALCPPPYHAHLPRARDLAGHGALACRLGRVWVEPKARRSRDNLAGVRL